jgi:hypothetical protein
LRSFCDGFFLSFRKLQNIILVSLKSKQPIKEHVDELQQFIPWSKLSLLISLTCDLKTYVIFLISYLLLSSSSTPFIHNLKWFLKQQIYLNSTFCFNVTKKRLMSGRLF